LSTKTLEWKGQISQLGIRTRNGYTAGAKDAIRYFLDRLTSGDPAVGEEILDYSFEPTGELDDWGYPIYKDTTKHKGWAGRYTPNQMRGIAAKLDAAVALFNARPETWIKGDLHRQNKEGHKACLMGAIRYGKAFKLKNYDDMALNSHWLSCNATAFMDFCEDHGLVEMNDSSYTDLTLFSQLAGRTAEALRQYAAAQDAGSSRTWQSVVNNVFWRQRKSAGLIK
jgi:hypothetical protein